MLNVLTDYGGYVDDNAASNAGAFNVESGVIEEVEHTYNISLRYGGVAAGKTPFYDDLVQIYQNLHVVDNNSNDNRGGGGVPRQPTSPPICD